MAFSGFHPLWRAELAAITPGGSCGLRPTRLAGADSTAGAPGGGDGMAACPGAAAIRPAAAARTVVRRTFTAGFFPTIRAFTPPCQLCGRLQALIQTNSHEGRN